uniref:Uncharacterized protein n=1 Tax=Alexandrium monilatum TaxID=311494 RepID=A0A7S4QYL9_9DINO
MAPGQRPTPAHRKAARTASGGSRAGSGADWEGHPRPRGRQERCRGRAIARTRRCAGGGPVGEGSPLGAMPRIYPAPTSTHPQLTPRWLRDDESWASSLTWRISRQLLQICFAAWQNCIEPSSEESWASATEWQRCRDRLKWHFVAWSLAFRCRKCRGEGAPAEEASHDLHAAGDRADSPAGDFGPAAAAEVSGAAPPFDEDSWAFAPPVSRQVTGDDSILGPDGDRYEVFYPRAHAKRVPAAGTRLASASRSSHAGRPRTATAEDYIGTIVSSMHSAVAARYPARSQLFNEVRNAAIEALGKGFERMAMVGSAALQIDTPASDIDAVAFTRSGHGSVETLRRIAEVLVAHDPTLGVHVIEYTRVPVLVVRTADGSLSLDLSVNQTLPEKHVLWFQSQRELSLAGVQYSPCPAEHGLEVEVLRCVKWWLWQRHVPASKEGGYPALVWTLMALHALRCSLFVDVDRSAPCSCNRRLLGALAAFFDRFSGCKSRSGTIVFAGDMCSEFRPTSQQAAEKQHSIWPSLSVLDPALVTQSADEPDLSAELAPRISPATQLLYAFELHRAARLSSRALDSLVPGGRGRDADEGGVQALRDLFRERDRSLNSLPTAPATERPRAAMLLRGSRLELGALVRAVPRPGWTAPFYHRRDLESDLFVSLYDVDEATGVVRQREGEDAEVRFSPHDFVALAALSAARGSGSLALEADDLERWMKMRDILQERCGDVERSLVEDHTCLGQRSQRQTARKLGCHPGKRDTRLP